MHTRTHTYLHSSTQIKIVNIWTFLVPQKITPCLYPTKVTTILTFVTLESSVCSQNNLGPEQALSGCHPPLSSLTQFLMFILGSLAPSSFCNTITDIGHHPSFFTHLSIFLKIQSLQGTITTWDRKQPKVPCQASQVQELFWPFSVIRRFPPRSLSLSSDCPPPVPGKDHKFQI